MDTPYPGVDGVLTMWVRKGLIDKTHKDALLSEITDDIENLRAELAKKELQYHEALNEIKSLKAVLGMSEKRNGACTHNAVNPSLGHTLCLKDLPCPDHG